MNAAESIRDLTLPVVLISANGLICLALYNRLAAITSRLRAFCRERFEMEMRLSEMETEGESSPLIERRIRARLTTLERQRAAVFGRAVQLRNALVLMLSAAVGFLATSLLLGVADTFALNAAFPLTAFVLGTFAMMAGIVLAIRELLFALDPVLAEHPTETDQDSPFESADDEETLDFAAAPRRPAFVAATVRRR